MAGVSRCCCENRAGTAGGHLKYSWHATLYETGQIDQLGAHALFELANAVTGCTGRNTQIRGGQGRGGHEAL